MVFQSPLKNLTLSVSPLYPVRKTAYLGPVNRPFYVFVSAGFEPNPNCKNS